MMELYDGTLESPPIGLVEVTPNDSADLPRLVRGFIVGTAGDVAVTMEDGTTGVLPSMVAGVTHAARVRRIHATGTTAENIVGLY